MESKISISKMTITDYEQIKDVLIQDFDDFWTPEMLKSEILGENKYYIVAKENDNIIGFAGILLNFDEAEIMNIVIKKSKRGQGIGKLLLHKIIEISKENNINKIFLEVNENNFIAIKMYEIAGFDKVYIREKYYPNSENAIIMVKNIKK